MPCPTPHERDLLDLQLFDSYKTHILSTAKAIYGHHKTLDIALGYRSPQTPSPSSSPTQPQPPAPSSSGAYTVLLIEYVEPAGTRFLVRGEERAGIVDAVVSLQQAVGQTLLGWFRRNREAFLERRRKDEPEAPASGEGSHLVQAGPLKFAAGGGVEVMRGERARSVEVLRARGL